MIGGEVMQVSEPEAQLLIVEDEPAILEGLVTLFEGQGFAVDTASDGLLALEKIAGGRYDLVLLDIMLPGMEGLEVLDRVRSQGDVTPVLMLTARGAEEDVVAGLERGADDYVTKPFGVHELVARVRGLLRRRARADENRGARHFQVAGCRFDLDQLLVSWGAGEIELTSREGLLLEFLVAHRHRPVERSELLVEVWGYRDGSVQTRTVDVHVGQLRSKLRALPADELIATVRGRGYRFVGDVQPASGDVEPVP
jgi:two-component system response regulator RegX3